jgi:hypothetical protein
VSFGVGVLTDVTEAFAASRAAYLPRVKRSHWTCHIATCDQRRHIPLGLLHPASEQIRVELVNISIVAAPGTTEPHAAS